MNTMDLSSYQLSQMNSFQGEFEDEPDIHSPKKKNLMMLKESISKLSTDFRQDRSFLNQFIKSSQSKVFKRYEDRKIGANKNSFRTMDQSDTTLPMIKPTSSRNGPIKSPVMESIRMSRQNQSKAFASLQKYRSPNKMNSSSDGSSKSSERVGIRQSMITAKKANPKQRMNNMWIVHKRDESKSKEPSESVIRASTYLANTAIYNKYKERNLKNKLKDSMIGDKYEDVVANANSCLRSNRKSKTIVMKDAIKNKIPKKIKRLNEAETLEESCIDVNIAEIDENMLLSMKSVDFKHGKFLYI